MFNKDMIPTDDLFAPVSFGGGGGGGGGGWRGNPHRDMPEPRPTIVESFENCMETVVAPAFPDGSATDPRNVAEVSKGAIVCGLIAVAESL